MAIVAVNELSYRYGRTHALRDLELSVPEGSLYALLGSNGSGKTTLLQILAGLRRAQTGRVTLFDVDSRALSLADRQRIGYIAEGQSLPSSMRLEQLEAYLAPMYPTWDAALARALRERFALDPRRIAGTLSRGEQMKAALLFALAPRPRLLFMDEPFTGMDAVVKDDLVRGLLDASGSEGWSVVVCSHDIGELEMLADRVGVLQDGHMALSESMDEVRARFKHVDVMHAGDAVGRSAAPRDWMNVERSGSRLSFVLDHRDTVPAEIALHAAFPPSARIDVRDATLREVFVSLAKRRSSAEPRHAEVMS